MRYLLAFLGFLLAGSIAAFLFYVPLWSIFMVILVFIGMALTFSLGVLVGSGQPLPWQHQFSDTVTDSHDFHTAAH